MPRGEGKDNATRLTMAVKIGFFPPLFLPHTTAKQPYTLKLLQRAAEKYIV